MRNLLLLLLFLMAMPSAVLPRATANWQRRVINYTRHEYRAGTQNWMFEQQDNGWIYVANNKGMLEFDGVNWTLCPMDGSKMRALRKADGGRIYAGGFSQLGYFEPDSLGHLHYHTLNGRLADVTHMGVVRNIWMRHGQVCFQADRNLFFYAPDADTIQAVDVKEQIFASAIIGHKLYVFTRRGLQLWTGTELQLLCGMAGQNVEHPVALLPYRDKMLIVTHSKGIFSYTPAEGIRRLHTAADPFLYANNAVCAAIQKSLLAVGSVQDGFCLIHLDTGQAEFLSAGEGLQNQTVQAILFDSGGNLWLGLDNGIDFVHLNSPVRSFYGRSSAIGSGYASAAFARHLYLGTNRGVFRTSLPGSEQPIEPVQLVEGTGGQVWSFLVHDNKLFCAADNGIFVIHPDGHCIHLPNLRRVRQLVAIPGHDDILVAGCYSVTRGLHLLRKTGADWRVDHPIAGCDVSCKSLLATTVDSVLWVSNREQGIYRVQLAAGFSRVANIRDYRPQSVPNRNYTCLASVNGEVVVASHAGLWRFSEEGDSLQRYTALEKRLGETCYTYLYEDSLHNLWHSDGNSLCWMRFDGVRNSYVQGAHNVNQGGLIESFEHVSTYCGRAVVATEDGFDLFESSGYDRLSGAVGSMPLTLAVRRAYSTAPSDSLVYVSSYFPGPSLEKPAFTLPFRNNSLRLCCAANNYDGKYTSRYSYRLDRNGETGIWTDFTENHIKEYTGLKEGTYTFHVKLDLPYSHHTSHYAEAHLTFQILPPWWRTVWSKLAYVGAAFLVAFYIRRRVVRGRRRLVMEQELELLRQQRKHEEEKELQDSQISLLREEKQSLMEEKLQSELRHKQDELVRSTLNIVRKNEMLEEIKKEVQGFSKVIGEETLPELRRRAMRLIGRISTNIEHDDDLKAFESSFDEVHRRFFSALSARFPELTQKDRQLCAYIRMNLQSKEIAPMMNVSVRAVEIGRYRLRNKLHLEKGDSLLEFLLRIEG